jgi:UMF1 family MFS transporter
MAENAAGEGTGRQRRWALVSWCVFDWANSAFPTVIVTFVFSAYFVRSVAVDTTTGTAQWGYALAISGLLVAALGPVLGAIADQRGRHKPWLGTLTALCVAATALLWFVRPQPNWVVWALVIFVVANTAFEMGTVFYNAMLPGIVPDRRIGRASGWGWGSGYLGGLGCLALALVVFVEPEVPLFGLDAAVAEPVRAVAPMVALWFAVFALPLFLLARDRPRRGVSIAVAARDGLRELWQTLRHVRHNANIARFLLARLLYIDGLNTLFAFGGIYAAGSFGMDMGEIIRFGIALNVTAGAGAAAFAWIDDWIGARRTILIALGGVMLFGVPLLIVESKAAFWALALPLGIFMGPAQAASRSLMVRLAPPQKMTEMFGLFALSGKITAFLGPALLAWATLAFSSQRAGMATVIVFVAAGAAVLLTVKEPVSSG